MPAFQLENLPAESESEPLTIVAEVVCGEGENLYTLAVGKTATGDHVLVRERTRGLFAGGATKAADKNDKRSTDNGTESYYKRTARLADIAAALAADLIG